MSPVQVSASLALSHLNLWSCYGCGLDAAGFGVVLAIPGAFADARPRWARLPVGQH